VGRASSFNHSYYSTSSTARLLGGAGTSDGDQSEWSRQRDARVLRNTQVRCLMRLPLHDIPIPKLHETRDHRYHSALVPAVFFTRFALLQRRSVELDLLPTTVPSDTFTYPKCPEDMIQELVRIPCAITPRY